LPVAGPSSAGEPSGLEPTGLKPIKFEPTELEPRGFESPGFEPREPEPSGLEPRGFESPGFEPREPEPSGLEPRGFAGAPAASREALLGAPVRSPRPSRLATPLSRSGRLGKALGELGLNTVGELLEHLPRDHRPACTIAQLAPGEQATVAVTVRTIRARPVRRRGMRGVVEATVFDHSGSIKATFFNQPWLVERYPPGSALMLHGKADGARRFRVSSHAHGPITGPPAAPAGGLGAGAAPDDWQGSAAHYPVTEGVSSTQVMALVREHREALPELPDPLPARLRAAERLADRAAALSAMHFPYAGRALEGARERLAFEELLLVQLELLRRRARREGGQLAPALGARRALTERWLAEQLPFELTGDQRRALEAIDRDMQRERPMQRLLMGEVGSGKTVVALYAMLRAVELGWQAALMAPTTTLAEQHIVTLRTLLGGTDGLGVASELLTGSTRARSRTRILGMLASGELPIVVGTHALVEDAVRFARLGVVIVDEQHRFGVRQRAALDSKAPEGLVPHVLHMTATPIPRTLALLDHADLDHTVLRELPSGRRPVATHVADGERERARAYERIREELRAGRQAFVVCPLVEESEALQVRAAIAELERLRDGELRDFRLALLHGQMAAHEKRRAMAAFAQGEADVLVATSVIEVGIDVPNATVMLIEDAERYGLAALHQLRGRVGRGGHESLCLLFGPKRSPRLQALAANGNGFELARIDLELRSHGSLMGVRQHGDAGYEVAELPRDEQLLERANAQASALIHADPGLRAPEHALLREALERARERAFGGQPAHAIPA
jgi:ATP-dependent DNA helicase RecG